MGGRRGRVVSEPKPSEPDEELLEFLGGIDEVNDETEDEDLTDLLAKAELEKLAAKKPLPPEKEEKSE
jgi:hypothetical protein